MVLNEQLQQVEQEKVTAMEEVQKSEPVEAAGAVEDGEIKEVDETQAEVAQVQQQLSQEQAPTEEAAVPMEEVAAETIEASHQQVLPPSEM